jgi:hypothetical protein
LVPLGKALVAIGLGVAALGAILWLGSGAPWLRLGRLPGDIHHQKDGFSLFVPITTMLLVSAVLTLVLWLFAALRR